jgi:hypothetical protein
MRPMLTRDAEARQYVLVEDLTKGYRTFIDLKVVASGCLYTVQYSTVACIWRDVLPYPRVPDNGPRPDLFGH